MASSEEVICKKHPNHKQQPGVCSCCLTERLIKLSTINSTPTISAISSSSYTYYSSLSSSTCDSPRGVIGHRRINSDVVGPFSLVSINISLMKSRSIAFVASEKKKKKKKEGFWSKLIRSTGNKTKRVLVH
ncbi:hypothetical protein HAX54_029053 [Datura stramonium]|uniref:Uncharacterized protein n=1 Tax=Datura stramonium TaxID=4076 RepID=A0ABS8S9Z5_DATST|nr:hypothetical protein [Datura stramonium]